jgi:alpha-1,2-mannosyltransferase
MAASLRALLAPGALTGILEYDDGVHYAASLNLLHGLAPYRDYSFLQPPGIALLLSPFAALGEWLGQPVGMAAARVAIIVVGVATIYVLWNETPARLTPRLMAGSSYALCGSVLIAHRTVLLEPIVNLGAVLALRLLRRGATPDVRRVFWAGVIFGVTTDVKLFAAVYPIVVTGTFLLAQRDGRRAGAHALGALIGFGALFAPFFVLAPVQSIKQVLVVQLQRPSSGGYSTSSRLSDILGLREATLGGSLIAAVALAFIFAVVAAHAMKTIADATFTVVILVSAAAFLRSPSYFTHYASFVMLPVALLVGRAVDQGTQDFRAGRKVLSLTAWLSSGIVAAVMVTGGIRVSGQEEAQSSIRSALDRAKINLSCVFTDSASLAIASNVLRPVDAPCERWVDGRGYALTLLNGRRTKNFYPAGFTRIETWQRQTQDQLTAATALLIRGDPTQLAEWSTETRQYVRAQFHEVARSKEGPAWEIWARTASRGS